MTLRHFIQFVIIFCLALSGSTLLAQQPAKKKNPKTQETPTTEVKEEEGLVVSVNTSQVVLNVTVTDLNEKFISGLKAENFKIFEDRTAQTIVSFGVEETPFTAAILLDMSGSMIPKMSLAKAACSRFASGIRTGDTIAIYGFKGFKVKQLQDFTEVKDVDPLVWDTDADGNTPLYDAVVTAAQALALRPEQRRAILVISDGADTSSKASFDQALRAANAANATIYTVDFSDAAVGVGINHDPGMQIIRDFANKTGGRFFTTPGGGKLRDAFESTVDELRHQYTIVYEPTNDKRDGKWRSVEVGINQPQLKTRTRSGYFGAKPEPQN